MAKFPLLGGVVGLKRPKVKMFHMAPKESDHELVKAAFALSNINLEVWLKSLNKDNQIKIKNILFSKHKLFSNTKCFWDTVHQYAAFVASHRLKEAVMLETVENVKQIKHIQDQKT